MPNCLPPPVSSTALVTLDRPAPAATAEVRRAAQPAPRVEVGFRRQGEETVLFVRDNGGGIEPRHLARVFGMFERLDSRAEGAGLGLALVRRVVESHGGRIWAESEGPGTGATFRFTLAGATDQ